MKSINFIEEEECPKHSDSLDIPDFRDIYHGCMSREVSVKTLRASGRDKCYLVRKRINAEEDADSVEYILSFVYGKDDYHFKIKKEQKYFIFANRYFPSFKCVISHYMLSNIINNAHLEFAVLNRTITAVRESLRGQRCYLSENLSEERMKELLCCGTTIVDGQQINLSQSDCAGSYLFRPRTEDNNQFVLMFFDGSSIHKLKMDVRLVDRKSPTTIDSEPTEPAVVLVLGKNYFESWQDLVDNFRVNPIVAVKGVNCENKLVREVDVNRNVAEPEDIYRKIKFNHALQQTDVYSIHGDVSYAEGPKIKWKSFYASVDKEHGHLILKNSKTNTLIIELIRCKFIPLHYSVHQKYCFLLLYRDPNGSTKNLYFSMCDLASPNDRRDNSSEETYAYRQYNLSEHDKEVYHCTEAGSEKNTDALVCRAYDRWTMAVRRHCSNTKDDMANEENQERHLKLHRYNRRLKVQIGHSGGPEISLTDADLCNVQLQNPYSAPNSSLGHFEVMVGNNVIATIPRLKDGPVQTILFQDLPPNIDDVSVVIRGKGTRRKEFIKELCNYTIVHQVLVPRPATSQSLCSLPQNPEQNNTSFNLSISSIQADPPSTCGPITLDCYASIEYKEIIILPFTNYAALSKYFMDNVRTIFANKNFWDSFSHAIELPEFKKLLHCFLYMAIWEKKQVDFLYIFFETDLKDSEPNMYFRQNTAASKLFLDYVFQFANDWLVCSFVQLFEEMYICMDNLVNIEPNVDDSNTVDPTDKQNTHDDTIYNCLAAALCGINENLKHCPLTLRQLFYMLQCEIKRRNPCSGDGDEGINYRLLTNLVMLRFFCAVLNFRGERQNDFFRKIAENIRKKNDQRFNDFPKIYAHQDVLNDYLVKISRWILNTYTANKTKDKCADDSNRLTDERPPDADINKLIKEYRDNTLQSLNEVLTRSLRKTEKDEIANQLTQESKAICRLSLSRRFNDALEFLTKLQEEPAYFLRNKPKTLIKRSDVISHELSAIVDEINHKKSCSNTTLIERL